MSAARTERLLNLLTLLLNSRRPLSLREIREMEEFVAYQTGDPKSGERAFERDKAALLELGVPLRWIAPEGQDDEEDGLGGYVIDKARYFLPDLHLEPAELALLSIAGAAAAALDGFTGRAAVIRALAKLGFDVEEAGRAPSLAHAPLMEGIDVARVGGFLSTLHEGVAERRPVYLTYCSHDVLTKRRVDPYGLYYKGGVWYLVGFCHLRVAERTFHLGRTQAVQFAGAARAFEVPAAFNLKEHVNRRPWAFPSGPPVDVRILLAERLVPAISEIFGPETERMQTPEGVVVRLSVTHEEALIAAVMPYGAAAQVLFPATLRKKVGDRFAALAARYAASHAALEAS